MKRIKSFGLIILLLMTSLLGGCFNYADINKVTFATSIIFDIDDLGRTIIYLDCIKPYRSTNESSDKGRRIIYKGIGKTSLEALRDINMLSSYKLNYSQTRAYIFTEKAARNGIKMFLDLINNSSEFQVKPSAFVYYGDVDELLKTTSTDEEYLGLFLNDLVQKNKYNPRCMESNINYYLSNTLMGSNTLLLSSIDLVEDALDRKIEINGGSIFRDNVLISRMDLNDSLTYNLIMGNVKSGTLELGNPQTDNGFITLEILDSTVMETLIYDNGNLKLVKNIDIDVSIAEAQGRLIVDDELLKYIKANKETYINGYVNYVFNKYKAKGLDIFNIERMVEINYPSKVIEDPLNKTIIEVNTNIIIKGTGVVKNSL
ncbi:MAG: Ger(x)C family spore germination protein [Clostridium sp.]